MKRIEKQWAVVEREDRGAKWRLRENGYYRYDTRKEAAEVVSALQRTYFMMSFRSVRLHSTWLEPRR